MRSLWRWVKPGRGSPWNKAMNSSNAMLYTRFVIGEDTLSRTSAFKFCPCAIFSTTIKSLISVLVIEELTCRLVVGVH